MFVSEKFAEHKLPGVSFREARQATNASWKALSAVDKKGFNDRANGQNEGVLDYERIDFGGHLVSRGACSGQLGARRSSTAST